MKKVLLTLLIASGFATLTHAQNLYWTSQGENIFSISPFKGADGKSILRFSALPNSEFAYNIDGKYFGAFVGIGVRNLGLIWEDSIKHKRRSHSLYVPAALKVGNVDNDVYFTLGAEMDMFFHYKTKDWINGEKVKSREWLSDEINMFNPSLAVGFNYHKLFFRVKYQMLNFFNTNYAVTENGVTTYPYRGQDSYIISFTFTLKNVIGGSDEEGGLGDLF